MVLYERYITGDNDRRCAQTNYWQAQAFTIGNTGDNTTHTVTSVKLKLYGMGDPGEVTVSIKAVDGDGKPTGADLCSGTLNGNDFSGSSAGLWYEFDFGAGTELSASTKYAIVIRAINGGTFDNCCWIIDETSPTYTGGSRIYSNDSGSTWTIVTTQDFMFEEYGTAADAPPPRIIRPTYSLGKGIQINNKHHCL